MGYRLQQFDGVDLGNCQIESDQEGQVHAPVLQIPGGWHDVYGSAIQRRLTAHMVAHRTQWNNNNNNLQASLKNLRARLGRVGSLKRIWEPTNETQRIQARLVRIGGSQGPVNRYTDIELEFQLLRPVWSGNLVDSSMRMLDDPDVPWTLDSGINLDDGVIQQTGNGTLQLALVNDGNAVQTDLSLEVRAISSSITRVHGYIRISGQIYTSWIYSATLAAGSILVVDGVRKIVTVNGSNAYSNFSFVGTHRLPDWYYVPPGGCTLRVNITSAGASHTATVGSYRHAWY